MVDQQAVDDLLSTVVERIESLDASLNGAQLDFTVDGDVATIHWMHAGKAGAGQGKMLFDFLLSRYPVVSTGVEGEYFLSCCA